MRNVCSFLLVLLISCQQKTKTNQNNPELVKNSIDTLKGMLNDKGMTAIYIKDKSQYDETFITRLADFKEPIRLIDDFILTGEDTTYFPSDLPLNKKTIFRATKDKGNIVLAVTRTNLTNLSYDFQLTDKDDNLIDHKSGKATLGSLFFLAPEGDSDKELETGYGSYEYRDESNYCQFSIRIGISLDANGKQRAKLEYSCEDKSKQTLNLDDCPTLRTE